jgi:hypothetical protein
MSAEADALAAELGLDAGVLGVLWYVMLYRNL